MPPEIITISIVLFLVLGIAAIVIMETANQITKHQIYYEQHSDVIQELSEITVDVLPPITQIQKEETEINDDIYQPSLINKD